MADENKFRLTMPSGVAPTGPVKDLAEAYMQAIVSIPLMIENLERSVNELTDAVGVLALYFQRKGISEGLMSAEEMDTDEEVEDGAGKTA
jgi:hypothetical protein